MTTDWSAVAFTGQKGPFGQEWEERGGCEIVPGNVKKRLLQKSEGKFSDRFVVGKCCGQDRKILSPHGCQPNSKNRGERYDRNCYYRTAIGFGFLGPFQAMIVCLEIKQKQPQDCKTIFETLSLPVAKIRSPVLSRDRRQRRTDSPGEFRGGFLWIFSGPSIGKKQEE